MTVDVLVLEGLSDRHPGVTPGLSSAYAEAAMVCLGRHHIPPSNMTVDCNNSKSLKLVAWVLPEDRMKKAWANQNDTTEFGACGISLAAIELDKGLIAVARAETGTGADYYISTIGSTFDDLEYEFRLEISGTDSGNSSDIRQLLKRKIKQAAGGESNLPAITAVVGFKELIVLIADVEEQ